MGLAGRKVKQRIGHDPRNLAWSDDAARFGSAYLAKFGWDASKGLGMEGEGRTSHIKVAQKLDLYGIGAAHQKDPNGIAWKQNKDFERLLERLNNPDGTNEAGQLKIAGFSAAKDMENDANAPTGVHSKTPNQTVSHMEGKKEKRKRRKDEVGGTSKEDKKKRKKSRDGVVEVSDQTLPLSDIEGSLGATKVTHLATKTEDESTSPPIRPRAVHPPRGHRARFIRSKRMALADSAAMAEVLGIAPTSSSSGIPSATPSTPLENISNDDSSANLELEQLTTSTKSVMDYFKEKLAAKCGSVSASTSQASPAPDSSDDADEAPRMGLGASRLRLSSTLDETPLQMGLGASLLARAVSLVATDPPHLEEDLRSQDVYQSPDTNDKEARRRAKKERKEARRKAKEMGAADATTVDPSIASSELCNVNSEVINPEKTKYADSTSASNDAKEEVCRQVFLWATSEGGDVSVDKKQKRKRRERS